MLPRNARLTSPEEFARATKSGLRLAGSSLVVYLYQSQTSEPARCGLVVSKSVGGSVVRHKIARLIRHALRDHLSQLPEGALLVVRALPTATTSEIRDELTKTLGKLIVKNLAKK